MRMRLELYWWELRTAGEGLRGVPSLGHLERVWVLGGWWVLSLGGKVLRHGVIERRQY